MRVTELLKKEHATISRMLTLLENMCERIQCGEKVKAMHVEQLFECLKVFAYHCHHIEEEAVLFPALKKLAIPAHCKSIDETIESHDLGRFHVERLRWGIAEYRADPQKGASSLITHAKRYVAFQNEDNEQEDHVLFPFVDATLNDEAEARILEGFDRVEQESLGEGKAAAVYQLLDQFTQIYLSGMESIQIEKEVRS